MKKHTTQSSSRQQTKKGDGGPPGPPTQTMDSYEQIETKLRNLEPFRGNSMMGLLDEWGSYKVYSYSTQIAQAWPSNDGMRVAMNEEKFSTTTSRHQNLIKRIWGV